MTWIRNDFLHRTPKTGQEKKTDKLDYIKIKNFCASKDIINQQSEKAPHGTEETVCKSYI